MGAVARFGRLPELYMMGMFYAGTMNPKMAIGDVGLTVPMLVKRKMQIVPRRAKGADEVSRIYKKAMERARSREKADAKLRAGAAAEAAKAAQAAADRGVAIDALTGWTSAASCRLSGERHRAS